MPYGVTIIVALIILGVFIVYKILHEALDFVHVGISVLGIALALSFFAVVYDAFSFKNNFSSSESILAFSDHGKLVLGSAIMAGKDPKVIPQETFEKIASSYDAKDYKAALGDFYKLIVVNISLVNASQDTSFYSASLFDNPTRFLSEYKKGNIFIYPETYMFKAIRYVPGVGSLGFFRDSFSKIMGKVNETSA